MATLPLARRRLLPELMDQPDLPSERHRHALRGLARINRLSGAASTLWSQLRPLSIGLGRPLRVLDVACGGGDVAIAIGRKARRAGIAVEMLGIDLSPTAVEHARRQAAEAGVRGAEADVQFQTLDALRDPLPSGNDAAICSLFLHHLDEGAAIELIARMAAACSQLLLVNDLRRSRRGYVLAHLACRALTKSPVVRIDGPRSVAGAFRESELADIFGRAGLHGATIERIWPFRLLATWRRR